MSRNLNGKSFLTFLIGLILCATFCLSASAQKGGARESPTPRPTPRVLPTVTPIKPSSDSQKKLPFAIRDNSPLSSVNVTYYQQVAELYIKDRDIETRNRLIFLAVAQIDLHFRNNERKVRHRNRLFQTVLDILEVGAATAISITNGERAKSIIADGLGFVQGSRESMNKNYRMLDRQVLVNVMVEKRAKVLAKIYERVGKSDTEYPFERAFIDLLDYFEAGRIDSALTELAKNSGSNAVIAETELDKAKREADITLGSSDETLRIAEENEATLQTIIDSEIKAGKSLAEAKARIKAADDVINNPDSPEPDKTKAQEAKKQAEKARDDALKTQTAEINKYKEISKGILEVPKLYVILDKLPSLYEPENVAEIKERVEKVKNGDATPEQYRRVLLRFYERISELADTDKESVDKAIQILNRASKEEETDGN